MSETPDLLEELAKSFRQAKVERATGTPKSRDGETLPAGSVVLDARRVAWQRTFSGSWRSTMGHELPAIDLDRRFGPLTVLHKAGPQ